MIAELRKFPQVATAALGGGNHPAQKRDAAFRAHRTNRDAMRALQTGEAPARRHNNPAACIKSQHGAHLRLIGGIVEKHGGWMLGGGRPPHVHGLGQLCGYFVADSGHLTEQSPEHL